MSNFGEGNNETLAELVWKFFEFWAWAHDFNNSVVSVRTGKFLTKAQKEWTRRIGNERHLICIEVKHSLNPSHLNLVLQPPLSDFWSAQRAALPHACHLT